MWRRGRCHERTLTVHGSERSPPSVTSIGMCLTQACLPKEPWLLARGLNHLQWPLCGLMDVLRADNGRDFRGEPLRRGCREHGIQLDFRPIAIPHFGGHIERLIGTMMGRIHLLPGYALRQEAARSAQLPHRYGR
jgi:putative transposase